MHYTYRLRRICALLAVLVVTAGCSHLHVDTLDAWTPQTIHTVVYTITDAPEAKADILVREQIRTLGWGVADSPNLADARVECEFAYKADLNSEGELTRTLESVHVRILDIPAGDTQAVSDYFYAHGKEQEWEEGVVAVFSALNADVAPQRVERTAVVPETPAVEPPATTETTETTGTTVGAQNNHVEVERKATSISTPEPALEQEEVRELENIRTRADIPEPKKVREPESIREPERMEKSPWVPRFQGWGLEAWGIEE